MTGYWRANYSDKWTMGQQQVSTCTANAQEAGLLDVLLESIDVQQTGSNYHSHTTPYLLQPFFGSPANYTQVAL